MPKLQSCRSLQVQTRRFQTPQNRLLVNVQCHLCTTLSHQLTPVHVVPTQKTLFACKQHKSKCCSNGVLKQLKAHAQVEVASYTEKIEWHLKCNDQTLNTIKTSKKFRNFFCKIHNYVHDSMLLCYQVQRPATIQETRCVYTLTDSEMVNQRSCCRLMKPVNTVWVLSATESRQTKISLNSNRFMGSIAGFIYITNNIDHHIRSQTELLK